MECSQNSILGNQKRIIREDFNKNQQKMILGVLELEKDSEYSDKYNLLIYRCPVCGKKTFPMFSDKKGDITKTDLGDLKKMFNKFKAHLKSRIREGDTKHFEYLKKFCPEDCERIISLNEEKLKNFKEIFNAS